jgi:hypothetical protein
VLFFMSEELFLVIAYAKYTSKRWLSQGVS